MMRHRLSILVVAAVAALTSSCAAIDLCRMDDKLTAAVAELDSATAGGPEAKAQQAALVELSASAATKAREESASDPVTSVSFYRVACVAAWKAGATSVVALSQEGSQVCARLPKQDDSAPRDCAAIKLAEPYAVAEAEIGKTDAFRRQLNDLRAADRGALLPASDAAPLNQIFVTLASQFDKVAGIRAGLSDAVPDQFKTQTTDQCLTIYCAAGVTSNLAAQVDGATLDSLEPQTTRLQQMQNKFQSTVGSFPTCRSTP